MLLSFSISAEKLVVIHQGLCKLWRNMCFGRVKVFFCDTRILVIHERLIGTKLKEESHIS